MRSYVQLLVKCGRMLEYRSATKEEMNTNSQTQPNSKYIIGHIIIQLNLSNQDTIVPDLSVLNSEVSSIQRLLSTQMWHLGVLNSEVSLIRVFLSIQM